mgnify:CR=1 FL=1
MTVSIQLIQVLEEEGYLEAFFDLEKENGFFSQPSDQREMLYTVTCLDGILYLAVPYLVFLAGGRCDAAGEGRAISWGTLLIGYVQHMCFFTLVYMTVVLAVILTGNLIVGYLEPAYFLAGDRAWLQ